MKHSLSLIAASTLAWAWVSVGQVNTFNILVSNDISPKSPSTTIEVWAIYDPSYYAFATARFELHASTDLGGFSDPCTLLRDAFGDPGTPSQDGDAVESIYIHQFHLYAGFFADTSNPLLLWQVTWSTTDFTPRRIVLDSLTTYFGLYVSGHGEGADLTEQFVEGHAEILISPCYPDFDENGDLDLFDFLEFVNLFNADDPTADCDASGSLDLFDFLCFVNAFAEGC
jgi:hypothetical protein